MSQPSSLRFGVFELDTGTGELRKHGVRLKIQDQPFQVLQALLERPGELVTREELQARIWANDTFVDFDQSLNRAINKVRDALSDTAGAPRFIETLPRRGYRFLAPVETAGTREVETAGRNRPALVAPDLAMASGVAAVYVPSGQGQHWGVAAILALVAAIAFWVVSRGPRITANRPFIQVEVDVGPNEFSHPAISADGTRIVVVSNGALTVRRFDQASATRLAGTEGAVLPFFSPNGLWVAFFAERKLQKVPVDGGAPVVLWDAPFNRGGTWSDDDYIVADLGEGLSRIPAAGGVPQPLTNPKSNPTGKWPQVLPGGKSVLFAVTNGSGQGELRVLTVNDGKVKTVIENATDGRYLASGYLVYYQQGTLFARPMDASRLVLTGPPMPLVHGVSSTGNWHRAEFDLSNTGTLVYRGGSAGTNFVLSWLDSAGKPEPLRVKPGRYSQPRLSPDGNRLALSVIQDGKPDLWVYDLIRETWNKLTSDGKPVLLPTWTPDGEYLAFRFGNALAWTRSDGSGSVEQLAGVSPNAGPSSFSADGKWLAFWPLQDDSDLWIVPVERTPGSLRLGKPQPLLQQPGTKGAPAISPDCRWVAYTSYESGRFEVYVMALSPQGRAVGSKVLVSDGGGTGPMWSHSGELFYQSLDRRIQVAAYKVIGDKFVAEKARHWSETRLVDTGFYGSFDIAADGKRVLAMLAAEDPRAATLVRAVFNVDAELQRRRARAR